jgi:hypothetical protein
MAEIAAAETVTAVPLRTVQAWAALAVAMLGSSAGRPSAVGGAADLHPPERKQLCST